MNRTTILAALSLIASTAWADIDLPEGKDIPKLWDGKDTVVFIQYANTIPYRDSTSLAMLKTICPTCTVDSSRKLLVMADSGTMVFTDSAGLPVKGITHLGSPIASGVLYDSASMSYDAQGRQLFSYSTEWHGSEGPFKDTTQWIWNHDGCADELETGNQSTTQERRTWSVDAQGHCLAMAQETRPSPSGSWSTTDSTLLTWNGNQLQTAIVFTSSSGVRDTSERQEFVYGTNGRLTLSRFYMKGDSGMYLAEVDSHEYDASKNWLGDKQSFYEESGTQSGYFIFSTRRTTTGIAAPAQRNLLAVSARSQAGRVTFENSGNTPLVIEIANLRGQRVATLTVEPGRAESTRCPPGRQLLLWKAQGLQGTSSGTLLTSP